MIRIAHCADLHLNANAKSNGLDRWPDQQRVVRAFVDGANDACCDIAVIAGDLFDTPKPSPAEIVFAQTAIRDLAAGMHVILIHGNHDMPAGGNPSPVAIFAEIENVSYFPTPGIVSKGGLQIATLPFPSKASLLTRDEYLGLAPEAVNALISDKLRAVVRGLRAQCDPGLPSVLVAHLPIVGAKLNENMLAGQEHISLTADDLEGWDYVALGHVAVTMICTPDGRLSRYLAGVEYDPQTLRMSLLEASEGKIGNPVDHLFLYCFQYDSTSGKYGPSAFKLMRLGAAAMVLVVGGVLLTYWRRERSREASAERREGAPGAAS